MLWSGERNKDTSPVVAGVCWCVGDEAGRSEWLGGSAGSVLGWDPRVSNRVPNQFGCLRPSNQSVPPVDNQQQKATREVARRIRGGDSADVRSVEEMTPRRVTEHYAIIAGF